MTGEIRAAELLFVLVGLAVMWAIVIWPAGRICRRLGFSPWLGILAVRQERRAKLPAQAIGYENGVEFHEGLAKYTEYRLLESLEGRTPGAKMWWVQGFHQAQPFHSSPPG